MNEPVVYVNGLFWRENQARVSVLDRGFSYGDGLFETLRAYRGKVYRMEDHLDRLNRSARLIFLELPVTRGEFSDAVNETLERNRFADAIIRLTVTRGEQSAGFPIDPSAAPTTVVHVRPFQPLPRAMYESGVGISLFTNSAPRLSGISHQIKSLNCLSQIVLRKQAQLEGSFEAILLDPSHHIADGTTCNIFIIKDGCLKTPKLNEYVLPGVVRQAVLELAGSANISCRETSMTVTDIYQADEIFLTNTGIEILPVQTADGRLVGKGKPGPVTRQLQTLFLKSFEVGSQK
ncbi:hypothetical protein UR09_05210 [Candidatus Nitromaritima sp. SCGC AAA799-A02]|nr:hypothetical protein UR09_05210 [Candidatus Nitromaritima sp. SCGC AAA799-A02]